jgi:ribonuclease Z
MSLFRLTFLGTSAAQPTASRNVSALAVRRGGELVLFDCGEGTQRQLIRYGAGFDVAAIFFTHFHADHYLGAIGFLRTLSMQHRGAPLRLYGPRPARRLLEVMLFTGADALSFEVDIRELAPGDAVPLAGAEVRAFATDHRTPSLGYALAEDARPGRFHPDRASALGVPPGPLFGRLQAGEAVDLGGGRIAAPEQVLGPPRPGRKIALAGDTRPAATVLAAAREADVLVHEATFAFEESERAGDTLHSTAADAAELARAAGVKMLVLTHLSNRYFGPEIAREARAVFPETVVPRDFDIIDVRFPERGGPRLVKGGALGRREEAEPHGSDGAGGGGTEPRRGGGDSDDPALARDPVGARAGSRPASDPAR